MPMPGSSDVPSEEEVKQGLFQYARLWGENSVPPALTGCLIAAQHLRPPQILPLLFPPILLFSSYLNVNGFKTDSAGLTAAWSAAYVVLARRRKQGLGSKFGVRGIVRGATIGLCLANVVSGGLVYAFSGKKKQGDERGE